MIYRYRSKIKDRLLLMAAAGGIFFGLSFLGSYLAYTLARSNFDGRFDAHIANLEANLQYNEKRISLLIEENKILRASAKFEMLVNQDQHEYNRKTIKVLRGTNVGLQREIDRFK